jgi:hypothetical protein
MVGIVVEVQLRSTDLHNLSKAFKGWIAMFDLVKVWKLET